MGWLLVLKRLGLKSSKGALNFCSTTNSKGQDQGQYNNRTQPGFYPILYSVLFLISFKFTNPIFSGHRNRQVNPSYWGPVHQIWRSNQVFLGSQRRQGIGWEHNGKVLTRNVGDWYVSISVFTMCLFIFNFSISHMFISYHILPKNKNTAKKRNRSNFSLKTTRIYMAKHREGRACQEAGQNRPPWGELIWSDVSLSCAFKP